VRQVSRHAAALVVALAAGSADGQPATTVELGPVGSGAPFSTVQPSLGLTPIIALQGEFAALGEIKWFAGNFAPRDFAPAAGQLLPIAGNSALFSRIGTTYGGDGRTTFALPDLRGRAALGFGDGLSLGEVVGAATTTLTEANLPPHAHATPTGPTSTTGEGAPVDSRQPGLALSHEIALTGIFPPRSAQAPAGPRRAAAPTPANFLDDEFIAAIGIFADADPADNRRAFTAADGALLPINQNQSLYSLLGTTYGKSASAASSLLIYITVVYR